jgi:hypothetical protein
MGLRAARDTAESLRVILELLEQSPDPDGDLPARAELKRILLLRIAELELSMSSSPPPRSSHESRQRQSRPQALKSLQKKADSEDPPVPTDSAAA